MNIGLYSVDSKMACLPLMKLAAYHKGRDHNAELFWGTGKYDRVYLSKIFNFSKLPTDIMCDDIQIGGTGYDLAKNLPDEIESLDPDYSIYPKCDYSPARAKGQNENQRTR
jgi:hypothetical protein